MTGSRSAPAGAAALVVLALLTHACGTGRSTGSGAPPAAPGTAAAVALSGADLPAGMRRCSYSGPVDSYIQHTRSLSLDHSLAAADTWDEMHKAGAVEGFFSAYAETERACRYFVTGPPEGYRTPGLRVATTLVARYADPSVAARGYLTAAFPQSGLSSSGNGGGIEGAVSGKDAKLGTYSASVIDHGTRPPVGRAVWQSGPFNVVVETRNLSDVQFDRVMTRVQHRALVKIEPARDLR